jgi:hypothetical protein
VAGTVEQGQLGANGKWRVLSVERSAAERSYNLKRIYSGTHVPDSTSFTVVLAFRHVTRPPRVSSGTFRMQHHGSCWARTRGIRR